MQGSNARFGLNGNDNVTLNDNVNIVYDNVNIREEAR